jgi:CheY-like chemotaxis protein
MSLSVLIVDDSELFLKVAGALLAREGLSVVGVASTTSDALARAEELRPDVVLVDIALAGESGFELTRRLVEQGQSGGPAVILISTHAQEDFADLIAECPATGFLAKSDLSADAVLRSLDRHSH